jgi:hypothetical protein
VLEYPLYLLELYYCDFFTFLVLNTSLERSHLESVEDIHRNMNIMKEVLKNDIQVFAGVGEMKNTCMKSEGQYNEGGHTH